MDLTGTEVEKIDKICRYKGIVAAGKRRAAGTVGPDRKIYIRKTGKSNKDNKKEKRNV